jgi:hypothetical protein
MPHFGHTVTTPADERRHPTGPEALWGESVYIDFCRADGTGGFVRLGLYPNLKQAWWWTYLLTPDGRLVAVRDHEVPLPRTGLEVRAEGLWTDVVCETPLEHWGVGLEAFGVALDDPSDSYGDEWGERLPVGLDLSWEATGPPGPPEEAPDPGGDGFAQPGRVEGEILIATERIAFDGWGWRARRWGPCDWWSGPRHWGAFIAEDGTALSMGGEGQAWWRRPPDAVPEAAEVKVETTVLGLAPVPLPGPDGRSARLERALCRVTSPGFEGIGWSDQLTNQTT